MSMRLPRRYEAILFDVGGTLLHVLRDPREVALEAIAHLGVVSPAGFVAGIRQAVEEWRVVDGRPEMEDLPETWVNHNRRALALAGFDGDISTAAELMEHTFLRGGWEVYSDVANVLAKLGRSGYRMGVVSNWPATLEATLERADLRKHFAAIVASGVVGYAKPHPEIFRIAAAQLGSDVPSTLLIGDSVELDVLGATAAGMDALLLDRSGVHASRQPRIESLTQLVDLLEGSL